jgi:hypothetical protein
MKSAGYFTGMIGKWHLGEANKGYDVFDSCPGYKPAGMKGSPCLGGQTSHRPEISKRIVSKALDFIDTSTGNASLSDKPFLLIVSHYDVHTPIQAEKADIKYYSEKRRSSESIYHSFTPGYAAMIKSVDDSVGLIRHRLVLRGVSDNTIFFFLSDNGGLSHITPSPFRGTKGTLYEGGLRVPFAVAWPSRIPQYKELQGSYGIVDFMPTLASLGGISGSQLVNILANNNQRIDGLNFLEFLQNDKMLLNYQGSLKYSSQHFKVIPKDVRLTNISYKWSFQVEGNENVNYMFPSHNRPLIYHQPHYLSKYHNQNPEQNAPYGSKFSSLMTKGVWRTVPDSAIIQDNMKLMKFWGPYNKTRIFLYNIETDPGEWYDLASHYSEIARRMEQILDEHLLVTNSPRHLKLNPFAKK